MTFTTDPAGLDSEILALYGRPMNVGGLSLKSLTGISLLNDTVFGSESLIASSKILNVLISMNVI